MDKPTPVLSINPMSTSAATLQPPQKTRSKISRKRGMQLHRHIESLACGQEMHHYQCASMNRSFSQFAANRMNPLGYAAWGMAAL